MTAGVWVSSPCQAPLRVRRRAPRFDSPLEKRRAWEGRWWPIVLVPPRNPRQPRGPRSEPTARITALLRFAANEQSPRHGAGRARCRRNYECLRAPPRDDRRRARTRPAGDNGMSQLLIERDGYTGRRNFTNAGCVTAPWSTSTSVRSGTDSHRRATGAADSDESVGSIPSSDRLRPARDWSVRRFRTQLSSATRHLPKLNLRSRFCNRTGRRDADLCSFYWGLHRHGHCALCCVAYPARQVRHLTAQLKRT
jgi:hypothetical protein